MTPTCSTCRHLEHPEEGEIIMAGPWCSNDACPVYMDVIDDPQTFGCTFHALTAAQARELAEVRKAITAASEKADSLRDYLCESSMFTALDELDHLLDAAMRSVAVLHAPTAAPGAASRQEPHTCHDMNPPFPDSCAACERERAEEAEDSILLAAKTMRGMCADALRRAILAAKTLPGTLPLTPEECVTIVENFQLLDVLPTPPQETPDE